MRLFVSYHRLFSCFQIAKDVIGFYDTVYDRGLQESTIEKKDAAATVLKVFHETVSHALLFCTLHLA